MKITLPPVSHPPGSGNYKSGRSDDNIVKAILRHDDAVIGAVYREYYQKIKKMVYTFHNTSLDPDDIFQEGLTRAVINVRKGKFRGDSSFLTYLNGICWYICLDELDRRKKGQAARQEIPVEADDFDFDLLDQLLLVRKQLDEKCRNIIDLRFGIDENEEDKTHSFEEVAGVLGLTPENARQRFKRCMDKLREYFNKNDELKSMFD